MVWASSARRRQQLNINSTVAGITDELSDYVGLKSGLAITAADVVRLLDRDLASSDESEWWCSPRGWLHESASGGCEYAPRI
jgi:hypothetical protein